MFEKKNGKRFLASVMALVMLLSLAPVGTLAAENEEQNQDVVALPADGDNQQAVADTPKEDTPTPQPAVADPVESSSEAVILPEGDPFDQDFSVNPDTSNSNAIAEHTGGNEGDRELVTTDSATKLVIRFYVSETGTKNSYTEQNKYTIANQPDSNKEEDTLELSVSPGYAILTGCNDVATGITWNDFTQVNITGDAEVKAWLNQHASKGVPAGLTDSATVDEIVRQVNEQYQGNNKGYDLPQLQKNYFTGFEFVEAKYVGSGESSIHVHVKLSRDSKYVTRTVHYKANNGTEEEGSDSKIYEKTATATTTVKENMFTWAGHKFTGWNTQANGTGTSYSPNRSIEFNNATDVTLYAQWEAKKYKVSYDLNYVGTTEECATKENVLWKNDELLPTTDPTRTGYKFTGWYTATENGTKVEGTTKYSEIAKNDGVEQVTLYAYWTANTHKVTYTDGANGTVFSNVEKTGTYGEDIPNYSDKNTDPTRKGYKFKGWTSSVSGITPASVMPDQEVTFTATWEKNQTTEPENPTSEINAKYFVLMPNMTAPTDGSSRGVGNYFPNDSDCGGVEGKTASTGYPGKIKSSLLSDHSTADTQSGYANTTSGIEGKYLEVPAEMGYFSEKNYANGEYTGYNKAKFPNVLKNLVGENQKFDMKNYQIVWYVVKKENNGYHVDGYVKGVPIQLNYYDGFNGRKIFDTENLQSGNSVTIKSVPANVTHDGWRFAGWFTKDGTKYEVNSKHTLIDSLNLYARWTTTYSVVTHFMGANGIEQEDLIQTSKNLTGTHGKLLSELVVQPNITGNYVYAPSETKYSVGNENKGSVANVTFTEANTVIHQYYYLDETGKPGKDSEGKDTDTPNGQPDAWEYKVTFKVVNGKWNDHDNSDNIVVYVNAKDKDGKTLESKLTEAQIPAVGEKPNSGYRASGNWDKSLSADLKITGDTEFTFTYSRRSSGGSSRPSTPPTVDIPDNDVPTGLNGKDHYAYIIGYGNNDVRPQNNITRAEVATIFFRLLTDETREANMTKSNGYNDVKDGDWFCCAVSTLSKMGIIKGYEDGSFKPNDPISRAEFAAIAARFDPNGDKTPASFFDVTSHWAKDEISIAANHGWIKGYEDGSFKPDQKITRAETMTLVNRVLNRLPEAKDDLHKDMKTWVDNMDETAWYYLAVQEATNSHYFKNKTGTKFEQWTDLRDTRDWSELEK